VQFSGDGARLLHAIPPAIATGIRPEGNLFAVGAAR
jgi:hypothetical protein